jgi:hypothetical protein
MIMWQASPCRDKGKDGHFLLATYSFLICGKNSPPRLAPLRFRDHEIDLRQIPIQRMDRNPFENLDPLSSTPQAVP